MDEEQKNKSNTQNLPISPEILSTYELRISGDFSISIF